MVINIVCSQILFRHDRKIMTGLKSEGIQPISFLYLILTGVAFATLFL